MRRFLTTAVFYVAGAAILLAQAPVQDSPVVGVGTFIHVVANLDKTMRFYGDRLGLGMNGAPGPRAFSTNAVVENLYNAKGSQSRVAVFKIPGSPLGLEFVEFQNASQQPFRPRVQDPGASLLTLAVPDVDSVMAKLREDATPFVGKEIIRDPDGFYVQLVEGKAGAKLSLTVARLDRTQHVFRDLLGFQFHGSRTKVPGTDLEMEFMEFKGVEHPPASVAIHDPGAGVLRLVVRDVDALLQNLRTAGVPVVTAGGEPVSIGDRHIVILRDPDNLFFQLVPQPPAPAPK